jgi:hypothetical protein
MGLGETGCEFMDCIQLAQNRAQWRLTFEFNKGKEFCDQILTTKFVPYTW